MANFLYRPAQKTRRVTLQDTIRDYGHYRETPDLSSFRGSFPKPAPKPKAQPKPIQPGKRTTAWIDGLKELKSEFAKHGIVRCELFLERCTFNNFLGFAHVKRRVNYSAEELADPNHVILACQPCHFAIDNEWPKWEAEEFMANIVKLRRW